MQRFIYALVALITLFMVAPRTTRAQSDTEKAAEPAVAPQKIDHHSESAAPVQAATPDNGSGSYLLPANKTVDNLVVRGKTLVLEGHVTHDVLAIDSNVVVKPGAQVGNYVDVIGGSVDNQAGDDVKVIRQDNGLASGLPAISSGVMWLEPHRAVSSTHRRDWPGGQFALWLLGMLVGLILNVLSPRAVQRTSDVVAMEGGRSLAFGVIGAGVIGFVLLCGSALLKSPIGLLLSPFIAALAVVCGIVLAYGWMCGMAHIGMLAQRRLGWHRSGWLKQITIGLTAFFLANLILGGISTGLGVTGLFVEGVFALMGLGAALLSGFGADPNWLTARWRGEIGWFTRTPRL